MDEQKTENQIKLSEVLETCLDFRQDPSDENEDKIQNLVNKFQIKPYMPLIKKQMLLICILEEIKEGMDASDIELNISMSKVYYGILQYVSNLNFDLEYYQINSAVIDCLYEFDIIDDILKYCERDYRRFEKMVQEAVQFANVFKIMEIPSLLDSAKLDEFTQTVASLKTELTPEMLENLKSISTEGSPEWRALKDTVADEVYGNVMEKQLQDIQPKSTELKQDSGVETKDGEPSETTTKVA